jgi:hypothetical protein
MALQAHSRAAQAANNRSAGLRQQWARPPATHARCRTLCCRGGPAAPAPAAPAPRRPASRPGPGRRPVVARTSEFWYDGEEEEFDGLTELLDPKRVTLLPAEQCRSGGGAEAAAAAAVLKGVPFVTAFASPGALADAEALWQELGRAGARAVLGGGGR